MRIWEGEWEEWGRYKGDIYEWMKESESINMWTWEWSWEWVWGRVRESDHEWMIYIYMNEWGMEDMRKNMRESE